MFYEFLSFILVFVVVLKKNVSVLVLVSKGVVLVLKEKFSAGLGLEGCGLGIDTPRSYYNPEGDASSYLVTAQWHFQDL